MGDGWGTSAAGTLRRDHALAVDTCVSGPDVWGSTPLLSVHAHGVHTLPQVLQAWDGWERASRWLCS
jgi:hypothetical protein